jgi:hypothetical protein
MPSNGCIVVSFWLGSVCFRQFLVFHRGSDFLPPAPLLSAEDCNSFQSSVCTAHATFFARHDIFNEESAHGALVEEVPWHGQNEIMAWTGRSKTAYRPAAELNYLFSLPQKTILQSVFYIALIQWCYFILWRADKTTLTHIYFKFQ